MSTHTNDKSDRDEDDALKSKSQVKRDMHALQDLGEELVKLTKDQFKKFDMPENLRDAITEARRMTSRGALKRQLQFVGRVMRSVEDPEPLYEQLDAIRGQSRIAAAKLHRIERWRDRLLEEGDSVLEELLVNHPDVDRQYLRQLLRNAHKETLANKPPRSTRLLFRYLRDLMTDDTGGQSTG